MKRFIKSIVFAILIVEVLLYQLSIRQNIDQSTRNIVLEKLHIIQIKMFSHQFRTKKDSFQLLGFKEQQDKATLAFCATIKVGQPHHDVAKPTSSKLFKKDNGIIKHDHDEIDNQVQEFNVLLDTGSTNVFLLGKQCNTTTCANHRKYDTKNAVDKWDSKIDSIGYISGSSKGKILADYVQIGNLEIKDQPIHVGYKVDIPVIQGAKWDGIVGLGYWYDKSIKQEEKDKSIIDIILDRNLVKRKVFSYYVPDQNGGKASFGELIDGVVKNESDIQYSDVANINDEAQWVIILKDIKFDFNSRHVDSFSKKGVDSYQKSVRFMKNNKYHDKQYQSRFQIYKQESKRAINVERSKASRKDTNRLEKERIKITNRLEKEKVSRSDKERLIEIEQKMVRENTWEHMMRHRKQEVKQNPCKDGCRLLVDTGTYLNYIPQAWFTYFMPESQFDFNRVLCKHKESFPDIVLSMKGSQKDYELRLSPEQYMENFNDGNDCTNTWTPDTIETNTITLGQSFLKNFYSIYDFGGSKKRVGFYRLSR